MLARKASFWIIISAISADTSFGCGLVGAVSIESTGALRPEVLFTEAVKILTDKCQRILTELS